MWILTDSKLLNNKNIRITTIYSLRWLKLSPHSIITPSRWEGLRCNVGGQGKCHKTCSHCWSWADVETARFLMEFVLIENASVFLLLSRFRRLMLKLKMTPTWPLITVLRSVLSAAFSDSPASSAGVQAMLNLQMLRKKNSQTAVSAFPDGLCSTATPFVTTPTCSHLAR